MTRPIVLVAMDSFKECASSAEVSQWVAQGLRMALPQSFLVETMEVCDGGTGFLSIISRAGTDMESHQLTVHDPTLGQLDGARYALVTSSEGKRVAVVESADSIGLARVPKDKEHVSLLGRSSFGLGEVLAEIAAKGPEEILIGMGDSGVQDCGVGLLAALGAEFILADGTRMSGVNATIRNLPNVQAVDVTNVVYLPPIRLACNLSSVLIGSSATVEKYATQKGASVDEVKQLRKWTHRISKVFESTAGIDIARSVGSGSSGGVGAALIAVFHAQPEYSFNTVDRWIRTRQRVQTADIIVVGEGRLDTGTVRGKAPGAVALMASAHGIPVVAVAGSVAPNVFGSLAVAGISAVQTLSTPSQHLPDYIETRKARPLLREAGIRVAPVIEMLIDKNQLNAKKIDSAPLVRNSKTGTRYEIAVFDLWQTVITRNWKHNFVEAIVRSLNNTGFNVDHALVQECLNASMLRRSANREVFASHLMDFISNDDPPTAEQRDVILGLIRNISTEQLQHAQWIPGAEDFLQELKQDGVHLVAVSNSTQEVEHVLSHLGVPGYFDEIMLSFRVALAKPNLGLFLDSQLIRSGLKIDRRMVFIGDQFEKDILPAQLLGVDAVLMKHKASYPAPYWQPTRPRIGMACGFSQLSELLRQEHTVVKG